MAGANERKERARIKIRQTPLIYTRHLGERVEEIHRPENVFRVNDALFTVDQLCRELAEDTCLLEHLLAVKLAVPIVERQ